MAGVAMSVMPELLEARVKVSSNAWFRQGLAFSGVS